MNAENNGHSVLVFIRGVPGSGKSYLTAALEESIGPENVVVLDPDRINFASKEYLAYSKDMSKQDVDEKFHPFRWLRFKAGQGISTHKIIIWNQPFTILDIFNRLIAFLTAYAAEHGTHLSVLIVEVEVDHSLAKQRVTQRKQAGGHGPTERTLARRFDDYKSYADQNYKTIAVNGDDDISKSVLAVKKAIAQLQNE